MEKKALDEVLKSDKTESTYYYELLGYLYSDTQISKSNILLY